jgi:hypothetical protein
VQFTKRQAHCAQAVFSFIVLCAQSACHFFGIVQADRIVQGRTRKITPSSADSIFVSDSNAVGSGFALLQAKAQAKEQTG